MSCRHLAVSSPCSCGTAAATTLHNAAQRCALTTPWAFIAHHSPIVRWGHVGTRRHTWAHVGRRERTDAGGAVKGSCTRSEDFSVLEVSSAKPKPRRPWLSGHCFCCLQCKRRTRSVLDQIQKSLRDLACMLGICWDAQAFKPEGGSLELQVPLC